MRRVEFVLLQDGVHSPAHCEQKLSLLFTSCSHFAAGEPDKSDSFPAAARMFVP